MNNTLAEAPLLNIQDSNLEVAKEECQQLQDLLSACVLVERSLNNEKYASKHAELKLLLSNFIAEVERLADAKAREVMALTIDWCRRVNE